MLLAPAKPPDVAGEFDGGELHAEADAKIGHAVFARIADRGDLALHAALAETARHQDGIHVLQAAGAFLLDAFRIDVVKIEFGAGMNAGVDQRFGERLVGIRQIDILADQRDVHLVQRMSRDRSTSFSHFDRSAGGALMPSLRQTISSSPCSCRKPGIL